MSREPGFHYQDSPSSSQTPSKEPSLPSWQETKQSSQSCPSHGVCSLCMHAIIKPLSHGFPNSKPLPGYRGVELSIFNRLQLKQVQKCQDCKLQNNLADATHHGRMIQEAKLCLIKSENFLQMNFSRIMPLLALQYYTHACSRSLTGTYFVVNLHKGLCK